MSSIKVTSKDPGSWTTPYVEIRKAGVPIDVGAGELMPLIRDLCKVAEEREELFPIYSCEGWAWRVLMEPEVVDE